MTERKDKKKPEALIHTQKECAYVCLPCTPRVVWLEREMNIQIQVWMQLLEAEQMLTGWRAVFEESKRKQKQRPNVLAKAGIPGFGLVLCFPLLGGTPYQDANGISAPRGYS